MEERNLIFISHANPEDNEFASWLGTRLTAAGYEVWADVLTLLGGEPFWRDIGDAIKEEAATVIVALSHDSYQKDGVLNEVALAVNTGRQLNKQQFVIPIRLDDLPFSDFPEQLIRLNAIDFSPNWADGFSKLLETLKDIQVPQSTSDFGESLASWQKFKLRQSASVSDTPEPIFLTGSKSTLYRLISIFLGSMRHRRPWSVRLMNFKAPQPRICGWPSALLMRIRFKWRLPIFHLNTLIMFH